MINFSLVIAAPWKVNFHNLFCWTTPLPVQHKYLEVEFLRIGNLVTAEFHWTVKQDHAGIRLSIGLFCYELAIQCYDNRHWDDEKNQWKCGNH